MFISVSYQNESNLKYFNDFTLFDFEASNNDTTVRVYTGRIHLYHTPQMYR